MADENKASQKPTGIFRVVPGSRLREAEQKHSEQRIKIAHAQRDIVGQLVHPLQ